MALPAAMPIRNAARAERPSASASVIAPTKLSPAPVALRTGTGGGWFDRALLHRRPGTPVLVLLNDDEVQAQPQLPHDQTVDWLVTPTRTIRTSITD